ncbi:LLM class flavin-dependent oxidoreductase [Streptomyces griseomycini]|uniref:LLM class flavin-dependent oxidoreductase n=1 Tax=Streptomyces griseomycini TaxID=66895 RepID=UPI003F4E0BC4
MTCPIVRHHPAVVAQASAALALVSGGRFVLGVGSGERLDGHVVGLEDARALDLPEKPPLTAVAAGGSGPGRAEAPTARGHAEQTPRRRRAPGRGSGQPRRRRSSMQRTLS